MPATSVSYKCPNCGAPLSYLPGTDHVTCEYCGTTFETDVIEDMFQKAQERAAAYEKSRAGGPVYLVRCLGCGTESRYLRRGKIVQLLEQHPKTRSCVCKKCGGRSFSLIVEEGLR